MQEEIDAMDSGGEEVDGGGFAVGCTFLFKLFDEVDFVFHEFVHSESFGDDFHRRVIHDEDKVSIPFCCFCVMVVERGREGRRELYCNIGLVGRVWQIKSSDLRESSKYK